MLGPLVNPAQPNHQLVGVFNLKLAKLYKFLHEDMDKKYRIVHSLDGYDEISLTSDAQVISNTGDAIIAPKDFNMKVLSQSDIFGGDSLESAANVFRNVLANKGTLAQKNVVVANAALAIQCFDETVSLLDCTLKAQESIDSGQALHSFQTLQN